MQHTFDPGLADLVHAPLSSLAGRQLESNTATFSGTPVPLAPKRKSNRRLTLLSSGTLIEWAHFTFNPWIGCTKVSAECKNCYAETWSERMGSAAVKGVKVWGPDAARHLTSDANWREPYRWNRAAMEAGERWRAFCASLADIFEGRADLDVLRARLWKVVEECTWIDWLFLTKRPENVLAMVPASWLTKWPPHVWIGTSAGTQATFDERLPHLAKIPAPVRFVSCEPMLGPVDISAYADAIDWVICGGESGAHARPMNVAHARALRDQCVSLGVAFFLKQWGEHDADGSDLGKKNTGRVLDGRTWDAFPTPHASAGPVTVDLPSAKSVVGSGLLPESAIPSGKAEAEAVHAIATLALAACGNAIDAALATLATASALVATKGGVK